MESDFALNGLFERLWHNKWNIIPIIFQSRHFLQIIPCHYDNIKEAAYCPIYSCCIRRSSEEARFSSCNAKPNSL